MQGILRPFNLNLKLFNPFLLGLIIFYETWVLLQWYSHLLTHLAYLVLEDTFFLSQFLVSKFKTLYSVTKQNDFRLKITFFLLKCTYVDFSVFFHFWVCLQHQNLLVATYHYLHFFLWLLQLFLEVNFLKATSSSNRDLVVKFPLHRLQLQKYVLYCKRLFFVSWYWEIINNLTVQEVGLSTKALHWQSYEISTLSW